MYICPRRNPFRRSPVRIYRGTLRNPLPGLAGLGQADSGTLDGGLSPDLLTQLQGLPYGTPYTQTPFVQTELALSGAAMNPNLPTGATSITDFLNTNASTMLWIGGIAIGVLLISQMAR